MQPRTLHVSIDLESELRKITQRQYLNDVHYLVQLVRHALLHIPTSIRIRSSRQWLQIHQDGQPSARTEWELLTLLLVENGVPDETRQRALAQLEERHGIALLSVLLTFPSASLTTRDMRLVASGSGIEVLREPTKIEGFAVRIRRNRSSRHQERRELEYFCSGARIPIYYNNKPINKAIELEGQILTLRAESAEGNGIVGIPYRGDMCRFEYFKNGVRIGLKQYLSDDGRVFHGFWDSSGSASEPHYRETVAYGDRFFHDQAQQLYELIGRHFETLTVEQRSRIKALLMGLEEATWHGLWADLPLFASSFEPFVFSLNDLLNLKERYGAVPCIVRPKRSAPRFIPSLSTEDIWFLKNELELPLQLFQGRRVAWRPRLRYLLRYLRMNRQENGRDAIPAMNLHETAAGFLNALNSDGSASEFFFVSGKSTLSENEKGKPHVYLQLDSPEVRHAMDIYERDPERLPLLRYTLIDVARHSMGRKSRRLRP